jgi:signal transduction histidine kinase/CheY-like chemotaxis protein
MATILVVDDRPLNRSLLTTLLGYSGHRLVEASNGTEAIEKALTEHPDLTITDILMPEMDGYQLVRKLREVEGSHKSKFIFYSATYLESEALALARACGVSHVICKPAEPELILKTVEEVLASGPSTGQPAESSPGAETQYYSEAIRVLNDKLYCKVEEAEELNKTLEKRVTDRTWELEISNHNLKKEILERQKAEAEAVHSREERLKVKGEFLSHISHELRSPLSVIYQFTTILLDGLGGALNKDQREYLEISLRNVNQLKLMIDDLLEASRAETSKLTIRRSAVSTTEVAAQVEQSLSTVAKEKGILLKIDPIGELPPVYADPGRISQVLTNLLDNAIKFSPPDTSVTVRMEVFADDPNFVLFSVTDCGCGIAPEHAEHVFDRLYQVEGAMHASRRGLGLGLYICKELIGLHGGAIWVNSKNKGIAGTTFHFTLPIFTIQSLIAQIAVKDGRLASSLILLTVEVLPTTHWQTEHDHEQMLNKTYQILERCMLPDLDVLLPVQSLPDTDLYSVVARTDQHGSEVMLSRLQDQFSGNPELQAAGVRCSIASELLDLGDLGKEMPLDDCVARVATDLKERIRMKTTKGAEHDDGKEIIAHRG